MHQFLNVIQGLKLQGLALLSNLAREQALSLLGASLTAVFSVKVCSELQK